MPSRGKTDRRRVGPGWVGAPLRQRTVADWHVFSGSVEAVLSVS
ncbi:hypothetical protein [Saccharomonospora viridis]|nr:hypothetical protein [Saccharomonospora viridis]